MVQRGYRVAAISGRCKRPGLTAFVSSSLTALIKLSRRWPMKILIVEDDPKRVKVFKENLIGCRVDWVDDSKKAIQFIQACPYDYVFLDFDIHSVDGVYKGSYREVYEYLYYNDVGSPNICIHTLNDMEGLNWLFKLATKYFTLYKPFAWQTLSYDNEKGICFSNRLIDWSKES